MAKKKAGNAKRSISKVKRNNQKKNKLIKRGELKPKRSSTTPYLEKQQREQVQKKQRKEEAAANNKRRLEEGADDEEDNDDENDFDPDDMMAPEDARLLAGISVGSAGGKNKKKQKLDDFETAALSRYEDEKEAKVKTRGLLPIKTKKGGIVMQAEVIEDDEDEDGGDSDLEDGAAQENGAKNDVDLKGAETTVLSLVSQREAALRQFKVQIGSMASNFLENPNERIYVLERLVAAIDSVDPLIATSGFRLASSTVCELLRDVIPSYRMDHMHEGGEGVQLKKDTFTLHKFEKGLLQCSKDFLMKLEKRMKNKTRGTDNFSSTGSHALRCMCDLLVAHPQFNFAPNMVNLLVPYLNSRNDGDRATAKSAVQSSFRGDKKGEISRTIVTRIGRMIKSREFNVHPDAIDCMLALRLSYVPRFDAAAEDDKRAKKKKIEALKRVSKKEKKRQKQLKSLEKELLEAKGEESKMVRENNFTACAKTLFEILFNIVKKLPNKRLLPPTLRCISVHCHAINVDFFHDLLAVFADLMKRDGELGAAERVLCVRATFDILTGPGEFLTYDPGTATRTLLELLPVIDLNKSGENFSGTVCPVLVNALVKRKKHVSKDLVRSFAKALAAMALRASAEESSKYLECLMQIRNAHFSTVEAMLSSEEEMVAAGPVTSMSSAPSGVLWELHTLKSHWQSSTAKLAAKLAVVRTQ